MADASTSSQQGEVGGIPKAEFIHDVQAFMDGKDADKMLARLQSDIQNYRMIEQELLKKRAALIQKLPELRRAVEIVKELISKQDADEVVTDYLLAEGVYAKARLKNVKTVNLWLGANVMVEYPLEEAKQMLDQNLENCKANLKTNENNIAWIKDNLTTTEVSMSRVYNYDVERRKKLKEAGELVEA